MCGIVCAGHVFGESAPKELQVTLAVRVVRSKHSLWLGHPENPLGASTYVHKSPIYAPRFPARGVRDIGEHVLLDITPTDPVVHLGKFRLIDVQFRAYI